MLCSAAPGGIGTSGLVVKGSAIVVLCAWWFVQENMVSTFLLISVLHYYDQENECIMQL